MTSLLGKSILSVTNRPPVRKLFTETRPGRSLSTRFVTGESLDSAAAVARDLNEAGMRVSLDHLGEHVSDLAQAEHARDDYLACLGRIASDELDANVSVKLSQLGMGFDDDLALRSLDALAARASEVGTTVTVDMEESDHTATTIDIYEKVQAERGNVGLAVQAYLLRTRADLERLIPLGGHIRLCKGAYAEPDDIAYQQRSEVDESYDQLLEIVMSAEGIRPAIATHDDDRIAWARRLGETRKGYYEFQMLYGIRTALQQQLVDDGLTLRIYVPYGVAWYPYLTRRLAERPANVGFFLRALVSRG